MDALVPREDDDLLDRILVNKENKKPNVWIQITYLMNLKLQITTSV